MHTLTVPSIGLALFAIGCGEPTTDDSTTTEPVANELPVVAALPDLEVAPGTTVTLAAQAADPDGEVASVVWVQTEGPDVVLSNATSLVATFEAPVPEADTRLAFELTVVDDDGDSTQVEVGVTVLANAVPLITVAGPDGQVDVGDTVTLLASTTDDFGDVSSVVWTQTAGEAVTLTVDGVKATFVVPDTRYGTDLAFRATATDRFGAEAAADVPVEARGAIDTAIEDALVDIVADDFSVIHEDGFLWSETAGDGVFKWQRTNTGPARNITAPIVRFFGMAGFDSVATLGLEDMYLRTNADPADPANIASADLGVLFYGYDLTGEQRFIDLGTATFDNAVTKYTFTDTFPRGIENFPTYPGLWGYDAQNAFYGWWQADQHSVDGAAAHLADQVAWYEARYGARVDAVPENAIFTNLIFEWYGVGARRDDVTLLPADLGFQYTAFAMMGDTIDADEGAEYLLANLDSPDLVSEEIAEGIWALTRYLDR